MVAQRFHPPRANAGLWLAFFSTLGLLLLASVSTSHAQDTTPHRDSSREKNRAGRVYFDNTSKMDVTVECVSYYDAENNRRTLKKAWTIPAKSATFLRYGAKDAPSILRARQLNYRIITNHGSTQSSYSLLDKQGDLSIRFTQDQLRRHIQQCEEAVPPPGEDTTTVDTGAANTIPPPPPAPPRKKISAPQQEPIPASAEATAAPIYHGDVRVVNRSRSPIVIVGDNYVALDGTRQTMPGIRWSFRPGDSGFLSLQRTRLKARELNLWLGVGKGETRWFVNQTDPEGALTFVVDDAMVARHLQRRRVGEGRPSEEAVLGAVAKLLGAAVAQAAATSGNAAEDDLGTVLGRAAALGIREGLIDSAVADLFPHFSGERAKTAKRVITLLIEGKLTPADVAQETARDALLDKVREQSPEMADMVDFVDFLDKLDTARRRAKN